MGELILTFRKRIWCLNLVDVFVLEDASFLLIMATKENNCEPCFVCSRGTPYSLDYSSVHLA